MTRNDELNDTTEQPSGTVEIEDNGDTEAGEQLVSGNRETAGPMMYLVVLCGGALLAYSVWELIQVFPYDF